MRFLLAALMAVALQQGPQDRPGSIEGTVMTAGAVPTPIAGAQLEVRGRAMVRAGAPPISLKGTTDGAGRFVFSDVPPGIYNLDVLNDGYGLWISKARIPISVKAGERTRVPPVSMSPAGRIRGQILGPDGNGEANAAVEFLRLTNDEDGRRKWTRVSSAILTNEDGKYQSPMLVPGDYYVRTIGVSGVSRVPVYYPETTEGGSAAPIALTEGSEKTADIRIRSDALTDTHNITGEVIRPPSEPVQSGFAEVILLKSNQGDPVEESVNPVARSEIVLTKGSDDANDLRRKFELRRVPPGRYDLVANANIDGKEYSAVSAIDVRGVGDIEKVDLALLPSVELKGRVVVEGELTDLQLWGRDRAAFSGPERSGQLKLTLQRRDRLPVGIAGPGPAVIAAHERVFSFANVPAGHYDLVATIEPNAQPPDPEYYVADVRASGRSVLDSGLQIGVDSMDSLEILIVAKGGTIEGKLTGSTPPFSAALILVPDAIRRGHSTFYKVLYVPRNGTFEMKGVAPGIYKLFAVPYVNETVPYRSPEFIARYESRAVTVTVQKEMTVGGVEVPYLAR
jgi:hypothetical protein